MQLENKQRVAIFHEVFDALGPKMYRRYIGLTEYLFAMSAIELLMFLDFVSYSEQT